MMKALPALLAASCLTAAPSWAREASLSVEDARALVGAALPATTARLPGLSIEADDESVHGARCWVFELLWANPHEGSAHVAFYGVDRRTGDVFEPTTCTRATGRVVERASAAVRRRLGVGPGELDRSRARPPCCR